MEEELARQQHAESCSQQLYVHVEVGDEWCLSGLHLGTSAV